MKKASRILRGVVILLVASSIRVTAQEKPPQSTGKTCETFLKEFYGWYLTKSRTTPPHGVWPLEITLKSNPPILSAGLTRGINAVDAEANKSQDAGLDFDPVLNTQDSGGPADPPYLIRDVKVNAGVCRADVYYQSTDGKTEKIVVPELHAQNDRWIFTNFHYPNFPSDPNSNLVSIIKNYLKP
jgi:hypothetical protein